MNFLVVLMCVCTPLPVLKNEGSHHRKESQSFRSCLRLKSKNMALSVLHYGSDGDQEDDCAWLIIKMTRG